MNFLLISLLIFNSNVKKEFKIAFNYIMNDSTKQNLFYPEESIEKKYNIFVSDSIVFIDATLFLNEIIQIKYASHLNANELKQLKNTEYIKLIKEGEKFNNYKVTELNKFNKNGKKDFILYFSVYNNILMAELFAYPRNALEIKINKLRLFNKSMQYLFYFNNEVELKAAYSKVVNYN